MREPFDRSRPARASHGDEEGAFHREDEGGFYGHDNPGFTPNPSSYGGTNAGMGGWYGNQGMAGDGGFQGGGGGYGIQTHLGRPRAYGFHDNYLHPHRGDAGRDLHLHRPAPRMARGPAMYGQDWSQGYGDETGFGTPAIERRGWGDDGSMPGARAPGRGPKSYKRSDERIREEVCEALADSTIDASEVEVAVSDGHVTLTGTIAHRADKRRLADIAETIRGVQDVSNDVRIPRAGADAPRATDDRTAPRDSPAPSARAPKIFS